MKKEQKLPDDKRNKNTSPTDIKGKDVNAANQTNSGAGGGDVKEGSNPLPPDTDNNRLDPMGTEVMQEDDYQEEKHGKRPADDQNENDTEADTSKQEDDVDNR